MIEEQTTEPVDIHALVNKVAELCGRGYRLVQIGCTMLEGGALEINYSFDKDYRFLNLRLTLPSCEYAVPSVSCVYWNAFLYENEMSDLFGIKVQDMAVDYKGKFYRTSVKWPFNPAKQEHKKDTPDET